MSTLLSLASVQLLLQEPFFGHLLTAILKNENTNIESLELSTLPHLQININPNYWNQSNFTADQRIGILKHQLLHLIFQHPFQLKKQPNPQLQSIALDVVVNQYLKSSQLLPNAIHTATFPNTNFSAFTSMEAAYQTLNQLLIDDNSMDSYVLQRLLNTPNIHLNQHNHWFENHTPSTQKMIKGQVQKLVQDGLTKLKKQGGKLAGNVEQILQNTWQSTSTVRWQKVVRHFANTHTSTILKNTIRRPSKRYGTTPGFKLLRNRQLIVGIDTSSSMSIPTIEAFYREIYQLWKRGHSVEIVEFDTIVQKVYSYDGQPFKTINGRGGTSLQVPLDYANQQRRVDGIIIFTDGKGKTETLASRFPLLWVISANGIDFQSYEWKQLPQRKIRMECIE